MDILSTWGPPLIAIGTVLFIWRELRADMRDLASLSECQILLKESHISRGFWNRGPQVRHRASNNWNYPSLIVKASI